MARSINFLQCSTFVAVLLALISCGNQTKEPEPVVPNPGRLIAAYTSGEISRSSSIRVRFYDDVVPAAQIDEVVTTSLFSFEPRIAGQAVWVDRRTLEFRPEVRLEAGSAYTASLSLTSLFQKLSDDERQFKFSFHTLPRSLDIQFGALTSAQQNALKFQHLSGTLVSADFEEAADMEGVFTARQGTTPLEVAWDHDIDGTLHRFTVSGIERKRDDSPLILAWDASSLGIVFKGERSFTVPAINRFTFISAEALVQGEQQVLLTFSDPLLADQDLLGLVHIEGHDLRFIIEGNQIRVYPRGRIVGTVTVQIEPGIRNIVGARIGTAATATLDFAESKPELRLATTKVILPQSGMALFPFEAINLSAVDVRVTKIYENNIQQFLQVNRLDDDNELYRVGEVVLEKSVVLDPNKKMDLKSWNRHVLDLGSLISADSGAIYRVTLAMRRPYSLYTCAETGEVEDPYADKPWRFHDEQDNNYYRDWRYHEDPCHDAYYHSYRRVSRNLLVSNLGLLAKADPGGELFFAVTDLRTTEPIAGANLEIFDYRHQLLTTLKSGREGVVRANIAGEPFLLVAHHAGQTGYLQLQSGYALNLSRFDVQGTTLEHGLQGFIYGERGVWRPGDDIYLTFILQDKAASLPADHPVTLEMTDPNGQLVQRLVQREQQNGFYSFKLKTDADAITGLYQARITVGGTVFSKTLKIETVMPNRLKLAFDPGGPALYRDKPATGTLAVTWLHGAVARNLDASVQVKVSPATTRFDSAPGFNFDDPSRYFESDQQEVFQGKVDEEGKATFPLKFEVAGEAPGKLRAVFFTKAFEPGGAFSQDYSAVDYHPYNTYAGVKIPNADENDNLLLNTRAHEVEVRTVDAEGKPVRRSGLEVQVFELDWHWWWDRDAMRITNYHSRELATPVATGVVDTDAEGKGTYLLQLSENHWGRFLLRVGEPGGHHGGRVFFMYGGYWASERFSDQPGGATMLTLSADKDRYSVGEKVTLSIPTGKAGRALVSLEAGAGQLASHWIEAVEGTTSFTFEATPEMAPNIYAFVTLLQPHAQTVNDLPIRLYGVVPINVEDPKSHLKPEIVMADVLEPEQEAVIRISEASGRAMTYTVAVVDEGLLDLTRFQTPDPWASFFARQALNVRTWDLYDLVLGAYGSEIETLLSIGGDDSAQVLDPVKANRFKPVVQFLGPFDLPAGETASHTILMPRYVGSVKTMVVAGRDGAFGRAEKQTPVRKPLMLLGTLPRVLGTGESVTFPLSVFAMEENMGDVRVRIEPNDLLLPRGATEQTLHFDRAGDQIASFPLEVAAAVGVGRIRATAVAGKQKAVFEIELDVRNPNPFVSRSLSKTLAPGETWTYDYEPVGMAGTNSGTVEVATVPPLNLDKRLDFLVQYPHGCVEQTTSGTFPQLMLADLVTLDDKRRNEVEANVRAGIKRLGSFQLTGGGLSYWPGDPEPNDWGTNYAGHFMLAADAAGYALPANFLERWLAYQKQRANAWSRSANREELTQAYRLFLLAMAGKPEMGAMNRFRELNHVHRVTPWLLGAAYHLAGRGEVARAMTSAVPAAIDEYTELSGTFGSDLRDRGLILNCLTLMTREQQASALARVISDNLNADQWYSTHALGVALYAMERYSLGGKNRMAFSYRIGSAAWRDIDGGKPLEQLALDLGAPGRLQLKNTSERSLFVNGYLRGQPLTGDQTDSAENLKIAVDYLDLAGNSIDIGQLNQGTDFYAQVTVIHPGGQRPFEEMALTQVFPSGWEIINERLGDDVGGGDQAQTFAKPDYRDIRDDRVYSYFDLQPGARKTFRVMLNASYRGRFYLPTVAAETMYDNKIHAHRHGRWVEVR